MDKRTVTKAASIGLVVVNMIIRALAVVTVPKNRRPGTAMAWLLAIFILPIPGVALFRMFGSTKLPEGRREKQRRINSLILEETKALNAEVPMLAEPAWFESVVRLNRNLGSMPIVPGNRLDLLPDYDESIRAMAEAVDAAERQVHVEFYILARDETTQVFFDALQRAHARGVEVRVLYDDWATTGNPRGRHTRAWLTENGIPFERMLPFDPFERRPDLRNHRKIVVVDGTIAFMGSQNMIDASYDKPGNVRRGLRWKDLVVKVEGPAALGLDALFITDWYSETNDLLDLDEIASTTTKQFEDGFECQVVPSGPGFEGENNLRLFDSLVYASQRRLVVTAPYFVPDDSMLYAMTTAAERGVDVELITCGVADQALVFYAQRSYYEQLLRSGVRIFLYPAPTVLHAKHFTIDDDVAVIGSSNMDMRSFSLNYEVTLMVRGRAFVEELRTIQDHDRDVSKELTLEEWLARPEPLKAVDNAARLVAAVM